MKDLHANIHGQDNASIPVSSAGGTPNFSGLHPHKEYLVTMASLTRGAKPVRMSAKNWASYSGVCLIGLLVVVVSFTQIVRRDGRASSFLSGGVANIKYKRTPRLSDINCEEEVGAMRTYIPAEHQYRPVRFNSNAKIRLHNEFEACRSKYKQHCYWKSNNYTPEPSFLRVLRNYEAHHRKCTQGHPLTDLALQGSAPSKCQYLVWRDLDGKGNQLISLVSAFVYALLTDRVLLITRGAEMQHLLCEPFHGSSWLLPEDFLDDRIRESSEMHGTFYDRVLNLSSTGRKDVIEIPPRLEAFMSNWQKQSDLRFFCEGEQKLVRRIPWVFYRTNQYSVPGFYFVPSFRTKLNIWFPDRAVFLHAGRYLLNPQNEIWEQIMSVYRLHMAAADRRLAIQVRAWSNGYTPIISEHILSCAVYAGVLPNVTAISTDPSQLLNDNVTDGDARGAPDPLDGERISVVLTSLRKEYAMKLAEVFNRSVHSIGNANSRVSIFNPSAEGEQQTGQLKHERKVIADMWLLSFADDIISSPRSTFGYVSHGLAGIKPIVFNQYGLDKEKVPNPPCWRANLPGPCFIDHPQNMQCPLDGSNSYIGDAHTELPEVRPCELQWGIGVFEDYAESVHPI